MIHYILIKDFGVYVKEGKFFISQGGLFEKWGDAWERIETTGIKEARAIAIKTRRHRFPNCFKIQGET